MAQKKFIPDSLDRKTIQLKVSDYKPGNIKLPFSSVTVIDSRYDTGKVGFVFRPVKFGAKKIMVEGGLAGATSSFYNNYYKNSFTSDSFQLLIVIKRFWADPKPNRKLQTPEPGLSRNSLFDLHIQFEFLLKKYDQYFPVKRIDTLFQWFAGIANSDYNFYKVNRYNEYEYALIKIMEIADFNYYIETIKKTGKPRTYNAIRSFNEDRFKIPVLQDSVFNAGVYMSFAEFRNNKPSIKKYKLVSDKLTGNIILNDVAGDSSRISKFWGFCDGKKIYFGKAQLSLRRAGNTFDFFVDNFIESSLQPTADLSSVSSVAASLLSSAYKPAYNYLEPFQLDMDTGRVY